MNVYKQNECDEELEIFDEQGNVIGLTSRTQCHANPSLLHGAVHVFVMDRNDRIFLQKRSHNKFIQPGKWDTSVGGHMSPGESPEQAARREMEEELGIEETQLEYLHRYIWRSPVETELVTTYRCKYEGSIRINADEIDEGRFFSIVELHQLKHQDIMTPNLQYELKLLRIIK